MLAQAVVQLFFALDGVDAKRIVEEHPDLASPSGLAHLDRFAQQFQTADHRLQGLRDRPLGRLFLKLVPDAWEEGAETQWERETNWSRALHSLLRACQEVGIDAAFADYVIPPQLEAMLDEYAKSAILASDGSLSPRGFQRAVQVKETRSHLRPDLWLRRRIEEPAVWAVAQLGVASFLLAGLSETRSHSEREIILEQAAHRCDLALNHLDPQQTPGEWAEAQATLGDIYTARRDIDHKAQAIQYYQAALEKLTREADEEAWARVHDRLAEAYREHMEAGEGDGRLRAIEHYRQALEVYTPDAFPAQCRRAAQSLGDLHFTARRWAEAHAAYQLGIEAFERQFGEATVKHVRLASSQNIDTVEEAISAQYEECIDERTRLALLQGTDALYSADAICLVRLGRLPAAMQVAEAGRARLLGEALSVENREMTADEIAELARQMDKALVYLIPSMHGTMLLLALPDGQLDRVFCSMYSKDDTDAALITLGIGWGGETEKILHGSRKEHHQKIDDLLGELGDALTGPLVRRLREADCKDVVLIAGGNLDWLPFSGAHYHPLPGDEATREDGRRYALDDVTISYAPSARVLLHLLARKPSRTPAAPSLFAVVDPTNELKFAPVEVRAIQSSFPSASVGILDGVKVSPKDVLDGAPGATYVHFACHGQYGSFEALEDQARQRDAGIFDMKSPPVWALTSGLMLGEGALLDAYTIREQLALAECRLVVLSACETGRTDTSVAPDEGIGLLGAFFEAGAQAIVSSLWPVDDLSTMLLMARFYCEHLENGLLPGPALREAQCWLKAATRNAIAEYCESRGLIGYLKALAELPRGEGPPYASPYFWAAFAFTGV